VKQDSRFFVIFSKFQPVVKSDNACVANISLADSYKH